jgi:cell division protein FtsB
MAAKQAKIPAGRAQKLQHLLLGVLAALVLVLLVGLWFGKKTLSSKSVQVAQTKAQADAVSNQYQALLNTKSEVKKLGNLPAIADQALPQTDNQSLDVAELTKFAGDNNINLTSIVFNDPKSAPKQAKLPSGVQPVSLSVQAQNMNYSQLLGFLREMEQSRHLMQPVNITISPSSNGKSISQLNLDISLYVRP